MAQTTDSNFKCITSLRGLALRATLLDSCGRAVDVATVPNTQVSSASYVSLNLSPDNEDGNQIRRQRADGSYCINDNGDRPKLMGLEATLDLCDIPIALNELLMCTTILANDANDPLGFVLPSTNNSDSSDNCNRNVLMEVWTQNGSKKVCDEDGNAFPYLRWFLPYSINWKLNGDITFEVSEAVSWQLMGYIENNPNFTSPVGLDNDPDLTPELIEAIRCGGPLAVICTNTLPEVNDCGYINPPLAAVA